METLRDILDGAAHGVFPPEDGRTTVVPQQSPRDAGVLAFTAHSVVFTDEDPQWVHDTLRAVDCDALSASMNPRFLAALMERTGRTAETIDAMLVGSPLPGGPPPSPPLTEIEDREHPVSGTPCSRRRRARLVGGGRGAGDGARDRRAAGGVGRGDRAATAPGPR